MPKIDLAAMKSPKELMDVVISEYLAGRATETDLETMLVIPIQRSWGIIKTRLASA